MRLVLLEKAIEAQRVLHLGRGQLEQLGDLDHGLERHTAQSLVDDVQGRQGDGLPRRIARKKGLDGRDHLVGQNALGGSTC